MTRHYPDLGGASDWLKQISQVARPIRSTNQIWVVTRHQYGISVLVSQTPFPGETVSGIAKCHLFLRPVMTQAINKDIKKMSTSLRIILSYFIMLE